MEIVVIIDRRPTCHIKGTVSIKFEAHFIVFLPGISGNAFFTGISGEEFARTVCLGQTRAYLQKVKII